MDRRIIDTAFAFDGWVYGGWVRDTCVLKQRDYNDIDLCFPRGTDIDKFIKVLKINMDAVEIAKSEYIEHHCLRQECLVIRESIFVDISLYDGSFEDWCNDRTADMSCNLFYKSKQVELGLRYIPDMYSTIPNPLEYVKELTRNHQFDLLFCQHGEYFNRNPRAHAQVVSRMKNMEWNLHHHIEYDFESILEFLDDEVLARYLKSIM